MIVQQVRTVPVAVCPATTDPAMPTVLITLDDVELITRSITAFQDLEAVSRPAGLDVTVPTVGCLARVNVASGVVVFPVTFVAADITCFRW